MSPCCKHSEKLFLRVAGLHNYETKFEILSPYKIAVVAAANGGKPLYDKAFYKINRSLNILVVLF